MSSPVVETDDFQRAFQGVFNGILRWEQLDELWSQLKAEADDGWYVYAVGGEVPSRPRPARELCTFLDEIHLLLREEHEERYCGIVYVDDVHRPAFVKIFDPSNLGSSCGCSTAQRLPGWTLSRLAPSDLSAPQPQPAMRRHWWDRIFRADSQPTP